MKVLDRTAVLFLGIAVGGAIGVAFAPRQSIGAPPARLAAAPATVGATPQVLLASMTATAGRAAHAARPLDCAVPFQPRLLSTLAKGEPVTIGVFGDSFGDGVWSALYWTLPKSEHFNVVKFSQEATGFTRYQSLNIEQRTAGQLDAQPVDVAVISFGANDIQGIADGGHVYPLFSEGWRRVYGERITRMVALLRSRGAMVYWVGLPKMRDPAFDEDITRLNAFLDERMTAMGVPFIDTAPLSVDDHGEFNLYLNDPARGAPRLMRANDGVHMTMAGYQRITAPLVGRIETYVAQSRLAAGLAPQMAVATPPAPAQAGSPAAAPGPGRAGRHADRRGRLLKTIAGLTAALMLTATASPAAAPCVGALCGAEALAPYFAALKADGAGHRGRPVHILILGDSHSASDNIFGAWREPLQARYGYGGRGVLPAGKPYVGFLPRGVHIEQSEGWVTQSILKDNAPGHPFGLSGFRLVAQHDGASLSIAADSAQVFNRLVICARDQPGSGAIAVTFGPTTTRISLSAQSPGEVCTALQVKEPTTSASLVAQGPVTLTSWATFNDAGGVAVSNMGVVGAQLSDFALNNDGAVAEELRAYQPDLIVLEFGVNEGFVAHFDPAAYEATLRGQIRRLRRLSGGAPMLLLGAPDANSNRPGQRANADGYAADPDPAGTAWYSPPALKAVRAIQRRVAASENVAFWDWAQRLGGPGYAERWATAQPPKMRGDHVHYTLAGGAEVARALQADIDAAEATLPPLELRGPPSTAFGGPPPPEGRN